MLLMISTGCGDPIPPQIVPSYLQGLEPPPLNKPWRPIAIKSEETSLNLPRDNQAATLVTQNNKAFRGEVQHIGTVTVDEEGIEFDPKQGKPLRILYRLPPGMLPLPKMQQPAELHIRELSGPGGADRVIMLKQGNALLFSEVWQRAKRPLQVKLIDTFRLQQAPTSEPTREGYTEAEAALYEDDELVAKLPIGKTIDVDTPAGSLQTFVETSHRYVPSKADAEQYPDEYILHAWVARLRSQQPAE